ncbi:hypothetical protein ACFSL4_12995 [Streptomyces caeni]|uniref:MarR family transcriptional regulator n=1 Tax=Streptomyces caeni TaxID=2307231 RepID=A0ABW4IP38_9ACTN
MSPEMIGADIGRRLQALAVTLRRYDGFVFRSWETAEPADGRLPEDDVSAAAAALVRRALRVACDPEGWKVLVRLREGEATTVELGAVLACPRIVAWEKVNDLLQAGLAGRELDGDRVAITAAGEGVLELVEGIADAAATAVKA